MINKIRFLILFINIKGKKIKTSAVKFLGLIFYVINTFLIFIPKKIKFKNGINPMIHKIRFEN